MRDENEKRRHGSQFLEGQSETPIVTGLGDQLPDALKIVNVKAHQKSLHLKSLLKRK